MDTIVERTDSLVGSFAIFNGWGFHFAVFCLALLFVFGTRVLFLFPRQHTWITYVVRAVGGAVPITMSLFGNCCCLQLVKFYQLCDLFPNP